MREEIPLSSYNAYISHMGPSLVINSKLLQIMVGTQSSGILTLKEKSGKRYNSYPGKNIKVLYFGIIFVLCFQLMAEMPGAFFYIV